MNRQPTTTWSEDSKALLGHSGDTPRPTPMLLMISSNSQLALKRTENSSKLKAEGTRIRRSGSNSRHASLTHDLCDSVENGDHEWTVKGQRVTLTTYIKAVDEYITSFEKRQAEIHRRLTSLEQPPAGSVASNSSDQTKDGANDESNNSLLCRRFVQVKPSDRRGLYQFIRYNPEIPQEEFIKYLWCVGADAIEKGSNEYAKTCFHHWRVLNDCLVLGPLAFFQAIMGPTCDVSIEFQRKAIEEYAHVWDTIFRAGRLDPSILSMCGSGCDDPDVELLCRE